MPERTISIAPVRLARARMRQALPSLLLLAGAGAVAAAGWLTGGITGLALAGGAAVLGVIALAALVVLLSVRVEVEVAMVRLRWFGGERAYRLARGPVTRVATRGPGAVRIRSRIGAFGWALGPAVLRDAEQIEIIRLAPVASLILVPTDRGRLAIAPASESELISALSAAARVQQRLDEATGYLRAHADAPLSVAAAPAPSPPGGVTEAEGRFLTGIERTLLEERLAAERAAALAAAEAERSAAAATATTSEAMPEARGDVTPARAADGVPGERRRSESLGAAVGHGLVGLAPAALPALAAAAIWLAAAITDRIPATELGLRPLLLALGLGAGGLVGVVAARAWYPRLAALVSATSLVALALVGRALLL